MINSNQEKIVPLANYLPAKNINNSIYISGQLPKDILNNNKLITDFLIENNSITIFDAKYTTIMCAMQILFVLKQKIEHLANIKLCAQLQIFVSSGHNFTNQHLIANYASNFICDVFGSLKGKAL